MKNLRNVRHSTIYPQSGCLSQCTWDLRTKSVIAASGPSKEATLVELRRYLVEEGEQNPDQTSELIASWDAPCPNPNLSCDYVVDIQHFPDDSNACLIFAGGDIVLVRENPSRHEDKIEIVGSVDAGIAAAAWSPDEELLVISTRADTNLFMSRDFDVIATVDAVSEDLQASKHVSVGWGKAETQFRGKGAKALRDPTMPEKVEEGLRSSTDDGVTTISWRGDGQYVAVNSLQASHRRVVRIYTREGSLHGVTEPVNFLEGALSWRPTGNLIAAVQRLEDEAKIVFFEMNGLRHGEFLLRVKKAELESWASSIRLCWNTDSNVLAVIFKDRVQLWTMGNYHYYLKSEILVSGTSGGSMLSLRWHPENPLSFAAVLHGSKGVIKVLDYCFDICRGALNRPYDTGAVAVVDGDQIKLTGLKYSNIPPPMAAQDVSVGSNLIDCALKNLDPRTVRVAALSSSEICVLDWRTDDASKIPSIRFRIPFLESLAEMLPSGHLSAMQLAFSDINTLILLYSQSSRNFLCSISVTDGHITSISKQGLLIKEISHHGEPEEEKFFVGFVNGIIKIEKNLNIVESALQKASLDQSKNVWDSFDILHFSGPQSNETAGTWNESNSIILSLQRNGVLKADKRILANNCTSFLTTRRYIVFTTSNHLLKFVHADSVDMLDIPPDTPEADERCRSIERGARLVTVIPSRSAIILQMPRGNLETIYPRALVLAEIRRSIDRKEYRKAFLSCRSHRVDMNILYDHNPSKFLKDVALFISQVKEIEYIDLFLSQLRHEDVSLTMYKDTIQQQKRNPVNGTKAAVRHSDSTGPKVNQICQEFIRCLRALDAQYLRSLITAHVCKTPPDLASGLKEVSKLQSEGSEAMESAVEHICFLVDVNKLYDAALGLYDLKLALLIAQQSQKDPREYLPFLNNLNAQSQLRMKYEIDHHLARRSLCLKHLKELDVFEELKVYTTKYELYSEAFDLYRYQEEKLNEIMRLYATYLSSKSRHKEAGIALEYLEQYEAASESYALAHLWRESLTSAYAAGLSTDRIESLARSLSNNLIELKDYTSAAIVVYEHLNDVEGAARLFCRAYLFANAARILNLNNRRDLLGKVLDRGLTEGMSSMTELLAECKAQLNAQVPRLRELREKKEREPLAFYDASANEGADVPDNVSLAPTDASTAGGTLFTRYTNRTGTVGTNATRKTSKNRRREERKRAMGKKGSVYEEEYLINSVGRLIERVNSVHDEVSRLITGLMQRRMRERAKAVHEAMISVVQLCHECVPEVYEVEDRAKEETPVEETEVYRPTGGYAVQWESMEALRKKQPPPFVKDFSRLALVGGDV